MTTRVVQVIYCDEATRGTGNDMQNLVRRLPALYTLKGDLICRFDCGNDGKGPDDQQLVNHAGLMSLERQR